MHMGETHPFGITHFVPSCLLDSLLFFLIHLLLHSLLSLAYFSSSLILQGFEAPYEKSHRKIKGGKREVQYEPQISVLKLA